MSQEHIINMADDIGRAIKEKCLQSQVRDACDILLSFHKLLETIYNDKKDILITSFIINSNFLLARLKDVDIIMLRQVIHKCFEAAEYITARYENYSNNDEFGEVTAKYIYNYIKRCVFIEKRNGLHEEYIKHFEKYILTNAAGDEIADFIDDIVKLGNDEIARDNINAGLLYYVKAITYWNYYNSGVDILKKIRQYIMMHAQDCDIAQIKKMCNKLKSPEIKALRILYDIIAEIQQMHNLDDEDKTVNDDIGLRYGDIRLDKIRMGDETYCLLIENLISKYLMENNPQGAHYILKEIVYNNDYDKNVEKNNILTNTILTIANEIAEHYEKQNNNRLAIDVYETVLDYIEDDDIYDRIVILKSRK